MSALSTSVNFINQRCFMVLNQRYPINASNTGLSDVVQILKASSVRWRHPVIPCYKVQVWRRFSKVGVTQVEVVI